MPNRLGAGCCPARSGARFRLVAASDADAPISAASAAAAAARRLPTIARLLPRQAPRKPRLDNSRGRLEREQRGGFGWHRSLRQLPQDPSPSAYTCAFGENLGARAPSAPSLPPGTFQLGRFSHVTEAFHGARSRDISGRYSGRRPSGQDAPDAGGSLEPLGEDP